MKDKDRTSISISAKLLAQGKARAARLGHENFSKYLAYLIADDIRTLRKHVVELDEPNAAGSRPYPPGETARKKSAC